MNLHSKMQASFLNGNLNLHFTGLQCLYENPNESIEHEEIDIESKITVKTNIDDLKKTKQMPDKSPSVKQSQAKELCPEVYSNPTVLTPLLPRNEASPSQIMNLDILPIRTESTPEALKTIKLLALKDSTRDKIMLIGYEMKSLDTTKTHLQEAGDHVCGVCNKRFGEESLLRLHERMHKRVFKCSKCADVCLSEELARQHYERCIIKPPKVYKCNKCVMQFTARNEYRRHIRCSHSSFVTCDHCGKQFTAKSSLAHHLLIHSGNVPMFECKICKKKYPWQSGLYQHMKTHNNKIDQAAYCSECNVQFKNKQHYKNHLKYSRNHVKEQDLKFPCPHCEKRFCSNSQRKSHIESMHSNETNYHCDECEKSFKALRRLRDHIRSAHEGYVRPSNCLCVVCGRKFRTKSKLNEHMNSHTGKRPYTCETCGATFGFSAALYTHKKKHKRCRALLEQQKTKRETNSDGNVEQTDS